MLEKSSVKCDFCKKKLKLLTDRYDCGCDKIFCAEHRIKDVHNCTNINVEQLRNNLAKNLPRVEFDKLIYRI